MKKLSKEKNAPINVGIESNNGNHPIKDQEDSRLSILKTYKLFIGGQFPRTESGRYIVVKTTTGSVMNICRASRKDLRNAVVSARQAFSSWSQKSTYNRSQILYRLAEMLEGRDAQFRQDLLHLGASEEDVRSEVEAAIDSIVHYAGWCDKYIQVFSSVNPVSSSHFNFSLPEPMGVVGLVMGDSTTFSSLISQMLPILVSGNSVVLLVPPDAAALSLDLAEVIATSDVPAGVINILSGLRSELLFQFASHLDVNAVISVGLPDLEVRQIQEWGAAHVLRVIVRELDNLPDSGPYTILDTCEIKTTWHPIGQ